MSVPDNASNTIGNQRPFIQNQRGPPGQGMPPRPLGFQQRQMQYHQQTGPMAHSQNFAPVQYNMGMMAPAGNHQLYVVPTAPVAFRMQNQQIFKVEHMPRQPQYRYCAPPQSMAPTAQAVNYSTSVSQPVPQQVAMPPLGIQPSIQGQMQSQQQMPSSAAPVTQPAQPQRSERSKITIRDPNQGGRDITEEILKKKKEPAAQVEAPPPAVAAPQTPVSVPVSGDEKIKAEFAAKVAAAKAGTFEQTGATDKPKPDQLPGIQPGTEINQKNESSLLEEPNVKTEPQAFAAESGQLEEHQKPISKVNDEDSRSKESSVVVCDSIPNVDTESAKKEENEVVVNGNDVDEPKGKISAEHVIEGSNDSTNDLNNETSDTAISVDEVKPSEEQAEMMENKENSMLPSDNTSRTSESYLSEADVDQTKNTNVDKGDAEIAVEPVPSEDANVVLDLPKDSEEKTEVDGPLTNGVDKPASSTSAPLVQAPKKKKKKEYRDKDTDLMSAFIDKPEEEVVETSPEEIEEGEIKEEPVVEEETWEDKDIKTDDDVSKAEKGRCYDRDFLLRFRFSTEKPKDLPNMDIILREANEPTKLEKERLPSSGGDFFMPKFMRQGSGGRQAGMSRSGKGGRLAPPKKIIPTNFDTKVELKKSENAWVRSSEKTKEPVGEESEIEALTRLATGILNKLTPQKFDKLVEQMKSLPIDTVEKLKCVIDLIFEKALSEPNFSKAYAQLCDEVSKKKISIESGKGSNVSFKRILLNKCQFEFEKEKSDEQQLEREQDKHYENADEEKAWQEELALKRQKTKRRSLGNIRFIGELFNLKMLTEAIMHTCITKLLKDRDEESLECLCKLVTTIGKDIDHEKAKPRTNQYFDQVDKIINQKKVSSRIIFMLQDLKDLRRSNWVARRILDAPKTIDEIHEEAKQEEIQMQMAHQQAAQKRLMNKGGRESPAPNRSMQSDEGWNQVQSKGGRNMVTVDPNRLKITKRTNSENISLGPTGRTTVAWAQGSSGGGSSRFALPAESESRQGNRFSALSGGDSGGSRLDSKGRAGQRSGQQSKFGRSSGPSSTKRGPQQQHMSDEKAAALATTRRMLSVEGNRTPSPSNSKPEDLEKGSPGTRTPETVAVESQEPEPADVSPVNEVSEQKIRNETKLTIDEFIATHDLKEAEICIRDLNCASKHNVVISEAINIAIEKKLDQCKEIGNLLLRFVMSGLVSLESFKEGLSEVLEFAEDIAVDIPHLWTNLGVILGPCVESEQLPLSVLKTLVEPLIECNKAGLLMAETLAAAAKISSESDIALLWQKSELSWGSLLREGASLDDFLVKHKMEFTTQQQNQQSQRDFRSILEKPSCTCEMAMDWIEKNVPKEQFEDFTFIRELSTAVYKKGVARESEFNAAPVKLFKNLLLKYIDNDRKKELQALYAAQLLAEELKHPKDFLRALFEALYDEEIISEDSVTAWEKSDEEPVGKGNALNSVQGFLTWLKNSEEETYDDSK